MSAHFVSGLGWLPDLPDKRDKSHTDLDKKPKQKTKSSPREAFCERVREQWGYRKFSHPALAARGKLLGNVDFSSFCSPIENQGELGSCTSQAVIGAMEYLQTCGQGQYIDGSRLFIYKASRNMLGFSGDTGAYVRTAIKALRLFGTCPEWYWPYTDANPDFDREPSAFCFAFAGNYKALQYFRLDYQGANFETQVLGTLASGIPIVFGFTVLDSISKADSDGNIPPPAANSTTLGGHAVMAVGYDKQHKVAGKAVPSIKIRNSWGTNWGEKGYGWLPFSYITEGLADDFWALVMVDFVDLSDAFPGGPDSGFAPATTDDKIPSPAVARGLLPTRWGNPVGWGNPIGIGNRSGWGNPVGWGNPIGCRPPEFGHLMR